MAKCPSRRRASVRAIDFQKLHDSCEGFDTYSEGLRAITEIFHALKISG